MLNPIAPARTLVEARLAAPASDKLVAFYDAPHLEREKRQFHQYLQVDIAHTVMLAEQGILSPAQARSILDVLREIRELGIARFPLDARKGSFLLQVEDYLFERIGEETGGRMHTGRSRLDQGPTVRRLFKRGELVKVLEAILALQRVLLDVAARHATTVMPGYTCLQHAHPAVFGHYLLAFSARLFDDFDRLCGAYSRLNRNPLGGAGLSGTSWPIDRYRTTELLGFDGLVDNAKLAREAYDGAEVASALSFTMSTLNDLATDLHIWSSFEFAYVETADEFCGTSSIFPQKKNPAGLEAVKFAAGGAVTWLATALATFRAEGTGDVVMREVPLLDDAFAATLGSLELMAAIMDSLTVNTARMLASASGNWSTATALADEVVRHCGLSFRQAHSVVARLVRQSIDAGIPASAVTAQMLAQAADDLDIAGVALSTAAIRTALDVQGFAATRTSTGGIAPGEVVRLSGAASAELARASDWLAACRHQIASADAMLEDALAKWTAAHAQ